MVHLTRIYTRTGDDGTTALGDFSRTSKTDPRLVAYADVDETNACIGVSRATAGISPVTDELLARVQNELFDVGADLCTPLQTSDGGADEQRPRPVALRISSDYVDRLERACDTFNESLDPLHSFVLPGGTPAAASLHVARTVARRAERSTWWALQEYPDGVNPLTARYLNRLSDLLFIVSRYENRTVGDVLWEPGGTRDTGTNSET